MAAFWQKLTPKSVMKIISFWPPYLAAGVSVDYVNDDTTIIDVSMKQRFYNTNYMGTHFGGSLYSMCDPFYMFILIQHLNKEHIVWDKAASIEFIKPGRGRVKARFEIDHKRIAEVKAQALESFKIHPVFETYVYDADGEKVAKISKTLYVRRKDAKERFKGGEKSPPVESV